MLYNKEMVVANHEVLRSGKLMELPGDTQFSYLDPRMGAIRRALAEGFSVSVQINYVGGAHTAVYDIFLSEKSIEELALQSGDLLGAAYETAELHAIAAFGADDELRRKILDSLENGFDVFLIPNQGVGSGTHYQFWCATYDQS